MNRNSERIPHISTNHRQIIVRPDGTATKPMPFLASEDINCVAISSYLGLGRASQRFLMVTLMGKDCRRWTT